MSKADFPPPSEKRGFTLKEAALYIGVTHYAMRLAFSNAKVNAKISFVPPTPSKEVKAGRFTRRYFTREELDRWLEDNPRTAPKRRRRA